MSDPGAAITDLLSRLANADPAVREHAAIEIFRRGCASAEPVLKQWFADPEFRKLLSGRGPLLTVGVAVEPPQFEAIRRRAGQARLAQTPAGQDVQEFELQFPHGVRLDVLTTRDPAGDGAIARFLRRFGSGIQQIECEVRDVTRATDLIRSRFELQPVYAETRSGADGTRVNFFLAPAAEGNKVLIELVEAHQTSRNAKGRNWPG
jgi:hypothetical protein